jgi:hypothetical protein
VQAEELGEVAKVLNFEPCTKVSLERCKPCGIISGFGNVIHVQCDHGEHVTGAENVNARVGDALSSPVVDKPCTKQHVELVRGLFKSVEAALEMTHFGRAISEAEGLADVHVLLNRGVEKRSVDVKLSQLKVAGSCDGKEEAKAGHADDKGEHVRIVEACALAAPIGDEPCFEAGDISGGVGLDFVDPHLLTTTRLGGRSTSSHVRLSVREEYSCCITACHWGPWALSNAARYDLGSTHSRAERRATAVGDVPAGVWGGPMIRSGTWGCSKMSSLALPCSGSQHAVTSVGG